jgi:fucose permease
MDHLTSFNIARIAELIVFSFFLFLYTGQDIMAEHWKMLLRLTRTNGRPHGMIKIRWPAAALSAL